MVANFQVLQPKTPAFCKPFACAGVQFLLPIWSNGIFRCSFSFAQFRCQFATTWCLFFVVLFPFSLTWRCRLVLFPPLLVAFVLLVLVVFAQLVGGALLNNPFHCFLFVGFFKLHSFCFPNNYPAKFQQNVVFTFGHFNNALGFQQVCISLTWRCRLVFSPLPLVYVAFVGGACSHCLEKNSFKLPFVLVAV